MDDTGLTVERDLEVLYRTHGDRLWWSILAFSGDREVASDAVAEAFAQALRRGDALRDPLRWVYRVAFRVAAGELQERRRYAMAAGPEPAYDLPEHATELVQALSTLSPNQRAAVALHYYADRPVHEVADILGMSAATASVHLHRARTKLRILLGDDDD